MSSRPSISGSSSLYNGLSLGGGRSRNQTRKRKKRVINLRRTNTDETTTPSNEATPRAKVASPPLPEEQPEDLSLPLRSPPKGVRFNNHHHHPHSSEPSAIFDSQGPSRTTRPSTPPPSHISLPPPNLSSTILHHPKPTTPSSKPPLLRSTSADKLPFWHPSASYPSLSTPTPTSTSSSTLTANSQPSLLPASNIVEASSAAAAGTPFASNFSGGILEQAWMVKMAKEIAVKVAEERERAGANAANAAGGMGGRKGEQSGLGKSAERDGGLDVGDAPPAYVA